MFGKKIFGGFERADEDALDQADFQANSGLWERHSGHGRGYDMNGLGRRFLWGSYFFSEFIDLSIFNIELKQICC